MALAPEIVLKNYIALKMHFTDEKYDAVKYSFSAGRMDIPALLQKRKDRAFFEKLSKKFSREHTLRDFLVSNIVYRNADWIGDFLDQEADLVFARFIKMSESFTYAFESDIISFRDQMLIKGFRHPGKLIENIEPGTDFPYIINLILRKKISIETLLTLDRIVSAQKYCPNEINFLLFKLNDIITDGGLNTTNFVWSQIYHKLKKYNRLMKPFVTVEQASIIVKNIFVKEQINEL